jgi:hypothetical protein
MQAFVSDFDGRRNVPGNSSRLKVVADAEHSVEAITLPDHTRLRLTVTIDPLEGLAPSSDATAARAAPPYTCAGCSVSLHTSMVFA